MMKPKYVYHGSANQLIGNQLLPRKANDLDEKNIYNSLNGVYASAVREQSIAMALLSCKEIKSGSLQMRKIREKLKIKYAIAYQGWPKQKYVYLYTLSSKTFINRPKGSPQWVSSKPIKPVKMEKLIVSDYLYLIRKPTKSEKKEWFAKYNNKINGGDLK